MVPTLTHNNQKCYKEHTAWLPVTKGAMESCFWKPSPCWLFPIIRLSWLSYTSIWAKWKPGSTKERSVCINQLRICGAPSQFHLETKQWTSSKNTKQGGIVAISLENWNTEQKHSPRTKPSSTVEMKHFQFKNIFKKIRYKISPIVGWCDGPLSVWLQTHNSGGVINLSQFSQSIVVSPRSSPSWRAGVEIKQTIEQWQQKLNFLEIVSAQWAVLISALFTSQ